MKTVTVRKKGHLYIPCKVAKCIVPERRDKVGSFGDYEFGFRAGPQRRKRLEVQASVHLHVYVSNLTSVCTLCTMHMHFFIFSITKSSD
jgi:hypothetical protein